MSKFHRNTMLLGWVILLQVVLFLPWLLVRHDWADAGIVAACGVAIAFMQRYNYTHKDEL